MERDEEQKRKIAKEEGPREWIGRKGRWMEGEGRAGGSSLMTTRARIEKNRGGEKKMDGKPENERKAVQGQYRSELKEYEKEELNNESHKRKDIKDE